MGALATIPHWLPQDDLLLKNAVEAGASLEALAKGAVRFSQRFTVQELKDRWYSLLYDPVTSAEASMHMTEFECFTSTEKFNKEAKCILGKRKSKSVRKCYYDMLKRIRSEPFDSMGIGFPGGTGVFHAGKNDEPLSVDCFFEDEGVSDFFGIQESDFGIMAHTFPELRATGTGSSSDGVSTSAFCHGLYDNDECKSLFQSSMPLNNYSSFDDNIPLTGEQNILEEFVQSKELQTGELFETMDLDIESSPIFEEIDDKEENVHTGFENKVYSSPPLNCGTSLPNFGYTSALHQMPNWSAVESLAPSTLADVIEETEDNAGNDLVTPVDFDANIPGYSSVDSIPEVRGQMPCAGVKDSVPNAEEYFAELSNSLLNFTPEDDLLFMDADGKDVIEKSYIENLSSLLLDPPDKDRTPNLDISEVTVAPHVCLSSSPSAAHPGESGEQEQYCCDDQRVVWSVEAQKLSSALTVNPSFPELRNGVIFCTLNTEDPEIPNNDDVFLPICLPSISISSMTHNKFDESCYPTLSSVKEFSYTQKASDRALMKNEQSNYSQLHAPSQMTRSSSQLEMGSSLQIDDLQLKLEPVHNDAQHATLGKATTCEPPALVNSVFSNNKNLVPGSRKQLPAKIERPNNIVNHNSCDSHIEKQAQTSNPHLSFQKSAARSQQDTDSISDIQNHEALHAEFCSVEKTTAEAIKIPVVSDLEELSCESDDDVPYFSDIETVIFGMDWSSDDQDLNCSPRDFKYQHVDASTIIRLEQAVNASSQRKLSSHAAYAILYGRHKKHFIKKTEVLLGRTTQDFKVDIDLGIECHANRISRRQATIKMDTNGTFHLTNHGKFSIFVDDKEVIPRGNVDLVSGCLIQVRGLPFRFETNKACIKQSLDYSGNESQSWEHKD